MAHILAERIGRISRGRGEKEEESRQANYTSEIMPTRYGGS